MSAKPTLQALLSVVDLNEVMIDRDNQPAFDRSQFIIYTPPEYLQSEHQDRDAVHRMTEEVLLHKATGLRVKYLVSESYYGEELRYRAVEVFVITHDAQRLVVLDWDSGKGVFVTPQGSVPFKLISRATSS